MPAGGVAGIRGPGPAPGKGSGRLARPVARELADQLRTAPPAGPDGAALGRVVDVYRTEALALAVRPLEVVQERPGEVTGRRCALAHGTRADGQVLLRTPRALRVVHRTAGHRTPRRGAAPAPGTRQGPPAHGGVPGAGRLCLPGAGDRPVRVRGDDLPEAVVRSEPVQRRRDGLRAARTQRWFHAVQAGHVLRVTAAADGSSHHRLMRPSARTVAAGSAALPRTGSIGLRLPTMPTRASGSSVTRRSRRLRRRDGGRVIAAAALS